MVRMITNFDLPKASCPDFISIDVLKNCKPEHLYISADIFNMCLKECFFPGICIKECWEELCGQKIVHC